MHLVSTFAEPESRIRLLFWLVSSCWRELPSCWCSDGCRCQSNTGFSDAYGLFRVKRTYNSNGRWLVQGPKRVCRREPLTVTCAPYLKAQGGGSRRWRMSYRGPRGMWSAQGTLSRGWGFTLSWLIAGMLREAENLAELPFTTVLSVSNELVFHNLKIQKVELKKIFCKIKSASNGSIRDNL